MNGNPGNSVETYGSEGSFELNLLITSKIISLFILPLAAVPFIVIVIFQADVLVGKLSIEFRPTWIINY